MGGMSPVVDGQEHEGWWCRYEHASLTALILPAADINVLSQEVEPGCADQRD